MSREPASDSSHESRLQGLARLLGEAARHDGLFWRRMAFLGAAHGPWWWRRFTPAMFGAAFWAALPRQRRNVVDNWLAMGLVRSRGDAELGALRTFVAFAEALTDSLEISHRGLDGYDLEATEPDPLLVALERGKGVVLLTAHSGSWEVNGRLIGFRHRIPVTMVMMPEPNRTARDFADRLRRTGDVEIAYVGGDALDALPLVGALRKGRVVAMQLDRAPEGMASHAAPFFGHRLAFPVGPFKLAQVTGAPVVPAFTRRIGFRRYGVHLPATFDVERAPGAAGRALLEDAMAGVVAELEQFVRTSPEQWFHFERLALLPA